mmetsp:Transcript_21151/g.60444  ORF Transcript_21151/g.60444 Transcript_21151/m.60444 type:complete len:207 (-) Transcript_21151:393-1013(-)
MEPPVQAHGARGKSCGSSGRSMQAQRFAEPGAGTEDTQRVGQRKRPTPCCSARLQRAPSLPRAAPRHGRIPVDSPMQLAWLPPGTEVTECAVLAILAPARRLRELARRCAAKGMPGATERGAPAGRWWAAAVCCGRAAGSGRRTAGGGAARRGFVKLLQHAGEEDVEPGRRQANRGGVARRAVRGRWCADARPNMSAAMRATVAEA